MAELIEHEVAGAGMDMAVCSNLPVVACVAEHRLVEGAWVVRIVMPDRQVLESAITDMVLEDWFKRDGLAGEDRAQLARHCLRGVREDWLTGVRWDEFCPPIGQAIDMGQVQVIPNTLESLGGSAAKIVLRYREGITDSNLSDAG